MWALVVSHPIDESMESNVAPAATRKKTTTLSSLPLEETASALDALHAKPVEPDAVVHSRSRMNLGVEMSV